MFRLCFSAPGLCDFKFNEAKDGFIGFSRTTEHSYQNAFSICQSCGAIFPQPRTAEEIESFAKKQFGPKPPPLYVTISNTLLRGLSIIIINNYDFMQHKRQYRNLKHAKID